MIRANSVYAGAGTTIFEVMSRLATEHRAINLGQGFPDDRGSEVVLRAAGAALEQGPNQYPPMMGHPELRAALAEHDARFYGLTFDPASEVLVTSGATEALAACFFGLLEPGDEVVLFDPAYDSYAPVVRRAGGVPRMVPLAPPLWSVDEERLRAAFNARTKLVVVNTPMNPAAKVFERTELVRICELAQEHDAYVIGDEVYEHLVFDGREHVSPITLPGMRERALKIGSAGKTFSLTGFKVGYVSGAAELLRSVARAHQFLTFATPPNLQRGVAAGLRQANDYFAGLRAGMQAKRDRFSTGLEAASFEVLPCQGTYFVLARYDGVTFSGDDRAFCEHLTREVKVAAIPVSALCVEPHIENTVRFCFAKQDAVLDEAAERLVEAFG